jgi:hypothetical protein
LPLSLEKKQAIISFPESAAKSRSRGEKKRKAVTVTDLQGQRVHVRAQSNEGRTAGADCCYHAGDGEGVPVGDPHGVELPAHELAGLELLVSQLRVLVDPPPHPDHPVREGRLLGKAQELRRVLQHRRPRRQRRRDRGGEDGEGEARDREQETRRRGGHGLLARVGLDRCADKAEGIR